MRGIASALPRLLARALPHTLHWLGYAHTDGAEYLESIRRSRVVSTPVRHAQRETVDSAQAPCYSSCVQGACTYTAG